MARKEEVKAFLPDHRKNRSIEVDDRFSRTHLPSPSFPSCLRVRGTMHIPRENFSLGGFPR